MARLDRSSAAGVAYGSAAPAIEVRSLSFAYPDADAAVLEGLDWSVPQGAFALLVGGTGSGKSTLLSLLKPEIAPAGERTGELSVLGENVADMDVRASTERVGYVFQDPENQIVCETVWHEMAFGLENLGLARDEMRRRVAETSYFFGLEDWLHRDTDTLSGGRKQLLSLAAVLALRPRVLLLDEPTSQLDPVAEKNFLHALFRVNRELGCTVVVATHQPRPMLEYATCAYRIEDGRVHEAADMASLVRRESLFSDDTLGWGAIRCAKNGVFSRREDNLGSLEPPGDVSSAKKVWNWTNRPNSWRKRRSRTAWKPSRARMEAEYSKKCTAGRLPPCRKAGFTTIERPAGCCAGSMRRFRPVRCMRSWAATDAVSRRYSRCWRRPPSCSAAAWCAERPRRRCCLRIPKHCWLPRRFAMS